MAKGEIAELQFDNTGSSCLSLSELAEVGGILLRGRNPAVRLPNDAESVVRLALKRKVLVLLDILVEPESEESVLQSA